MALAVAPIISGKFARPTTPCSYFLVDPLKITASPNTRTVHVSVCVPVPLLVMSTRFVFASAFEVDFDRQGRFLLPTSLRTWAGLEGEAVIVGSRDHAEVWTPARWDDYRRELESPEALAQHLSGLGI